MSNERNPNLSSIVRTIQLLNQRQQNLVIELRALGGGRRGIISGYFKNHSDLITEARRLEGQVEGIYVTLNPVEPALYSRAANKTRDNSKHTTSDSNILRRHWMLVDLDPKRPSGISSTNDEHNAAIEIARGCRDFLLTRGWPKPVFADSGNGAHLLYAIDLPNDEESRTLVSKCLEALSFVFSNKNVEVDKSTCNAARISKLYGTLTCKGDSTSERPHRYSKIIECPDAVKVVDKVLLQSVAALLPSEKPPRLESMSFQEFDLEAWIVRNKLPVTSSGDWNGGTRWKLSQCPWNSDHINQSAYIVRLSNGAIGAGCLHSSCRNKGWPDLRRLFEPDKAPIGSDKSDESSVLTDHDWPVPIPLNESLLPVDEFDYDLLPKAFREWVRDVADRMQCPPDFLAASILVVCGTLIGRQLGVMPKEYDNWLVFPGVWGAIVGPPGCMKTPALNETMLYLENLEKEAAEQFKSDEEEWKAKKFLNENLKEAYRPRLKEILKGGDANDPEAMKIARSVVGNEKTDKGPARKRYKVNDTTIEKLGEILAVNPNGLLVFRDELTGWLNFLDKDGNETARAFCLEGWGGTRSSFACDRVIRGTTDIAFPRISVLGGIQPGPLVHYLRNTSIGNRDDGLIQRFQLFVWPDIGAKWANIDRIANQEAKKVAFDAFARLKTVDLNGLNASFSEDHRAHYLRFSPEVARTFAEYRTELEERIRSNQEDPAFESHLAKYRSMVPALALICHVIDFPDVPDVNLPSINRAKKWASYLESHAKRLYGAVAAGSVKSAFALLKRIKKKEILSPFSSRDIYRNHWSGLNRLEAVKEALDILEEHFFIKSSSIQGDGRPSTKYFVNPKCFVLPIKG